MVPTPSEERMRIAPPCRSEEHTSELQSQSNLVCRLLLEKKNHLSLAPPACTFAAPGQIGADVVPLATHAVDDRVHRGFAHRVAPAPSPLQVTGLHRDRT